MAVFFLKKVPSFFSESMSRYLRSRDVRLCQELISIWRLLKEKPNFLSFRDQSGGTSLHNGARTFEIFFAIFDFPKYRHIVPEINDSGTMCITDFFQNKYLAYFEVHIFWEGHKILRNLHLTFVLCSVTQSKVRWRFRKILWLSQNIWTSK